jgi:transposase-like protein
MELNLSTLAKHFSEEPAAWELVEKMRWPNGPVCPHCGDTGRAYFLQPRNGTRTTTTGKVSYRRLWKCKVCRRKFSVLVGTIFERSQVPLSKWLLALYLMSASKNGVAANELRRTLGVTEPTAWFMLHRLREAMRHASFEPMSGTVVSDETWIGGEPRNRHHHKGDVSRRGSGTDKTPVVSLINARTGETRSVVLANVDSTTLRKAMIEMGVDMGASVLWTDEGRTYTALGRRFLAHETANHGKGEYVNAHGAGTNLAENRFAQLKRSIDGTHHYVSREHLHRYVHEHDFRFSTCKMSDWARMQRIIDQSEGRRLTYRRVTAA